MKNKKSFIKKAAYLAAFASLALCSAYLGHDSSRISNPFMLEKCNANGSASSYCNDFDISRDDNCNTIPNFAKKENEKFGKVSKSGTEYGIGERITYQSHWASWQEPTKENFNERIFITYRFQHYVSVPLKTVCNYCLRPNESVSFTITHSTSSTQTVAEAVENSYSFALTATQKMGVNLGVSIPLGNIELGGKLSSETSIGVTQTLSSTVRNEASKSFTYEEKQSSTWTFFNNTSKKRFYKLNYRKTFKLYFTTQYRYNYSCTRTGVNAFGLDDQFTYTFLNYIPERTVFFFVPINDEVYFEKDEYYNNANGDQEIDDGLEDNVVTI